MTWLKVRRLKPQADLNKHVKLFKYAVFASCFNFVRKVLKTISLLNTLTVNHSPNSVLKKLVKISFFNLLVILVIPDQVRLWLQNPCMYYSEQLFVLLHINLAFTLKRGRLSFFLWHVQTLTISQTIWSEMLHENIWFHICSCLNKSNITLVILLKVKFVNNLKGLEQITLLI